MNKDLTLAINDIRIAQAKGEPIYEVKHHNTTLEFSPRIANIRKAVSSTINCTVYRIGTTGSKSVVVVRRNKKMVRNDINLQVGEAA